MHTNYLQISARERDLAPRFYYKRTKTYTCFQRLRYFARKLLAFLFTQVLDLDQMWFIFQILPNIVNYVGWSLLPHRHLHPDWRLHLFRIGGGVSDERSCDSQGAAIQVRADDEEG